MPDVKYGYPYPAQGAPVMPPPQYTAAPRKRRPGFLEGCLAALCCCCVLDDCCCDPILLCVP